MTLFASALLSAICLAGQPLKQVGVKPDPAVPDKDVPAQKADTPAEKTDDRILEQKAKMELMQKRAVLQKEEYIQQASQVKINDLNRKIKGFDEKIAVEQVEIKQVNEKKDELEKKLADIKSQLNGNNYNNSVLQVEKKKKEREVETYTKRIEKYEKAVAKLEGEKGKIQDALATAEGDFATQKAKVDGLRSEYNELDKAIKGGNSADIAAKTENPTTKNDKDVVDVAPVKKTAPAGAKKDDVIDVKPTPKKNGSPASAPGPDGEEPAGFDALSPPKK